jgi:hypothetical protein
MFKTISAALLAVSVMAAPAFATTTRTGQAPLIKATQVKATQVKTTKAKATQAKATQVKTPVKASVLNANAKMGEYHHNHVRHHHHYQHTRKMGAIKTHAKVGYRHTTHTTTKRG